VQLTRPPPFFRSQKLYKVVITTTLLPTSGVYAPRYTVLFIIYVFFSPLAPVIIMVRAASFLLSLFFSSFLKLTRKTHLNFFRPSSGAYYGPFHCCNSVINIDVYRESTPFWELKKKDLFGSRRDTKKKRIVGTRDVCCSFGIDIYSNRIRKDAADSVYRCRGENEAAGLYTNRFLSNSSSS